MFDASGVLRVLAHGHIVGTLRERCLQTTGSVGRAVGCDVRMTLRAYFRKQVARTKDRQSNTQANVVVRVRAVNAAVRQVEHDGVGAAGELRAPGAANANPLLPICSGTRRGHAGTVANRVRHEVCGAPPATVTSGAFLRCWREGHHWRQVGAGWGAKNHKCPLYFEPSEGREDVPRSARKDACCPRGERGRRPPAFRMRARRPCEDPVETRSSPGHRPRTRTAKRTAARSRPRGPVSRTRNLFRGVVGAVIALRHHDRPFSSSVRPVRRGLPSPRLRVHRWLHARGRGLRHIRGDPRRDPWL